MIWTPSLASCITGRIFSFIADTCIHKGLKLSTSSNKLMSVMLVPGWASVINEARSSISDAWSSIPWTMITGLKQNIFVRDNNKSAKKSSRETKFAMSSTVLDVVQASECKEPADWPQQKGIWKPINKHGLLRGWLLFQRGIWRQLQGIWIWRPPWLFGKCIWYNTFVFTWLFCKFLDHGWKDHSLMRREQCTFSCSGALNTQKSKGMCYFDGVLGSTLLPTWW